MDKTVVDKTVSQKKVDKTGSPNNNNNDPRWNLAYRSRKLFQMCLSYFQDGTSGQNGGRAHFHVDLAFELEHERIKHSEMMKMKI